MMKRILLATLIAATAPVPGAALAAIKDYGLKEYVRVSKDLPHSESQPWKLVCTMPYNCHFQSWIEMEAEAGQVIRFNSSNPLVLYLTKTETYTTKAGIQVVEAKHWVSGEGAIYSIPAGVTVKSVKYRETGYDTTFAASFECNDSDFSVLWKKAARTAYICMRDHFYDCPDRERVGFWGDGTPELNQCFYVFDSNAHRLAKELVLRKLEPKFYPGQHLEFLGDYGLWFYYLQTGDIESMRAIYEPTKIFLFETYKFGNKRTWFDWGKENKDTAVTETCFFFNCLGTLRKIALATGHDADVPAIDQKLEEIRSTFDSQYWKGGYYMSSQVTEPDDRANAMAVNAGLADRSKWQAIYGNVLNEKTYSSCFFDRWVFEALCIMGKQEHALMRMQERYRTMIPASFTTLWEHYDRWWASRIDVSAANALDGDHWTGWRDMTKTQYGGQWFQVDMQREQTFDRIVLDATWALWDSPDKYSVSVSKDGTNWSKSIATGSGQLGITTISFPSQNARHIRIEQTGTSAKYHWSIYELDVYRAARVD